MSSVNSDSSSFPVWILFITFSCLVVVIMTSNTIFNKRGKGGHSYLVPDLRGNAFSFHIEYDVSCGAFIMLRYVPSTGFPRGSVVKNPPVVQEIQVRSLGREDPLEKEMTTHSRKSHGQRSLVDNDPWVVKSWT